MSVLFVGSVSAVTLDESDITYGAVTEITSDKGAGFVQPVPYTNDNYKNTVIEYNSADLNVIDWNAGGIDRLIDRTAVDAAWIGFRITLPTASSYTVTGTYAVNGVDKGDVDSGDLDFYKSITKDDMMKAIAENDGILTNTYKFTWNVKQAEKVIGTFTQTVILKVDATKATLNDTTSSAKDDTILWSPDKAKEYAAQLAAEKEAEGNNGQVSSGETKGTGSQKDDVPKTGEVFPMALVGIMALGTVAGGYTVKSVREYFDKRTVCRKCLSNTSCSRNKFS